MNTIRIDKYLAQLNLVSRREAKKFFRSGRLMVNGLVELDHGFEVIDGDKISIVSGEELFPPARRKENIGAELLEFEVQQTVTLILHKPAGYVCSEIDEGGHQSYKALLSDFIYAPMLKVAGRLDADTTGLLIVTSDGQLNHRLTSPKSHKEKEYLVRCQNPISDTDLSQLEQGVKIENDYLTLPAKAVRKDDVSFVLTIIEGKYHQVKQMCEAVGNVCIALHRMRVDRWTLEGIEEEKWEMLNFRF